MPPTDVIVQNITGIDPGTVEAGGIVTVQTSDLPQDQVQYYNDNLSVVVFVRGMLAGQEEPFHLANMECLNDKSFNLFSVEIPADVKAGEYIMSFEFVSRFRDPDFSSQRSIFTGDAAPFEVTQASPGEDTPTINSIIPRSMALQQLKENRTVTFRGTNLMKIAKVIMIGTSALQMTITVKTNETIRCQARSTSGLSAGDRIRFRFMKVDGSPLLVPGNISLQLEE